MIEVGCQEYRALSRRQFLGQAGSVALLGAAAAMYPEVVRAESFSSNRDILVTIFLRGAADGLSMCVPFGEASYYTGRPSQAISPPDRVTDPNRAIDLNGFFGFPKGFQPLMEAYQSGDLLVVHATGSIDPTRSHFDGQRYMEVGKPSDGSIATGWTGRYLATTPPSVPGSQLRAVAMYSESIPRSLVGGPHVAPVTDPYNYGIAGSSAQKAERKQFLTHAYERFTDPLKTAARNTQATIDLLGAIDFTNYIPAGGANYGPTSFGHAMRACGAIIRSDIGVEALNVNVNGWDTHVAQGAPNGYLAAHLANFGTAISAFYNDMQASNRMNRTTLIVMSEFGRTVNENASSGTDHGHGSAMLLLGGGVRGGRVFANWPGLLPHQLYDGQDLQVTIDHRDILAEVLAKRLEATTLSTIFPDFVPTFRNVVDPIA